MVMRNVLLATVGCLKTSYTTSLDTSSGNLSGRDLSDLLSKDMCVLGGFPKRTSKERLIG